MIAEGVVEQDRYFPFDDVSKLVGNLENQFRVTIQSGADLDAKHRGPQLAPRMTRNTATTAMTDESVTRTRDKKSVRYPLHRW